MTNAAIKQEAKALIDSLSGAQLRAASEFLAFVKDRKADAATLELLAIPGFEDSFARGMRDIKARNACTNGIEPRDSALAHLGCVPSQRSSSLLRVSARC